MNKLYYPFLLFLCICFSFRVHAQFDFSAGLTVAATNTRTLTFMDRHYNGSSNYDTSYSQYRINSLGYGILAYPKFHVVEVANHSISIGAPVSFGFNGELNSQTGGYLDFFYDANISIDFNGGRLNKKNEDRGFIGYYIGFGYGVGNSSGVSYSGGSLSQKPSGTDIIDLSSGGYEYDYMNGKGSGILIHGAIAIPLKVKDPEASDKSMGLRLFIRPSLNADKFTYFGGSLFIRF